MRKHKHKCTFISEGICTFCAEAREDAAASEEAARARVGAVLGFEAVPAREKAELEAAAVLPKPPKLKAAALDAAALEAAADRYKD